MRGFVVATLVTVGCAGQSLEERLDGSDERQWARYDACGIKRCAEIVGASEYDVESNIDAGGVLWCAEKGGSLEAYDPQ